MSNFLVSVNTLCSDTKGFACSHVLIMRQQNNSDKHQIYPVAQLIDEKRHAPVKCQLESPVLLFSEMGQQLEDAIWVHMTSFHHAEGTYSIPEGEAVKEMLAIIQGQRQ